MDSMSYSVRRPATLALRRISFPLRYPRCRKACWDTPSQGMIPLYLVSLLVGGGLLIAATIGSGDHGHDGHISHDAAHEGRHGNAAQFLSLRTLTYFLLSLEESAPRVEPSATVPAKVADYPVAKTTVEVAR